MCHSIVRTFALLLLLAGPALGDERAWTISTGVATVQADLLAVRGDTAYLKIGDKVEAVPLARLSAEDRQFIATLPQASVVTAAAATTDILPVSGVTTGERSSDFSVLRKGPELTGPITEEAMPLPSMSPTPPPTPPRQTLAPVTGGTTRNYANYNSNLGTTTQQSNTASRTAQPYRTTGSQQNYLNPNARAVALQQQQLQQQQLKKKAPPKPPEPPPGLLGIRARRYDRANGR